MPKTGGQRFLVCRPTIDDLQVSAKAVDLVLGADQQFQQRICHPKDTGSCPDDPERSIQGVLNGRLELCGLLSSPDDSPSMDL